MKKMNEAVRVLSAMGLTEMEARIYSFLLVKNPATGYQIAREVDKPVANIYKSLSSLEIKGAVVVEGDKKRLYKPVPSAEFLNILGNKFIQRKNRAVSVLESLDSFPRDERVYQIYSSELVFEKMKSMINRAEKTIVLDIFPEVFQRIKNHLINTLKEKKLEVMVKVYQEVRIPSARTVIDSRGSQVVEDYPGEWVKIVIDAREHLLALLSKDCEGIHQAIWSTSNFLSLLYHQSILSEILLDEVNRYTEEKNLKRIKEVLEDYSREKKYQSPGYQDLINKFKEKREV